jgi:hypothetical protein
MNVKFKIGNLRLAVCGMAICGASTRAARLANETTTEGMIGIANEYREGDWIQLTPLGNFPHARGIQRVDADAVTRMANQFNSLLAKAGRALFGGVPFFVGHPDVPALANEFPDRKAYGWVKSLEARADGLYGQVEWSEPGKTLLANKHYKFFSPYWDARVVGTEGGKTVYQPTALLSVGLTNQPNLPVKPLANEKENDMEPTMKLAAIVALLGLANTATEAEVTTEINRIKGEAGKVTGLANEKTTATTGLENEKTEHGKTKTKLENAIVQRNKFALDLAVKEGRLAPAEREAWATKLANNYDDGIKELETKKPTLKTSPIVGAGERRTTLANAQERTAKVQELVQKEMKDSGTNYETAFQRVRMANAALFDQMHDSLKPAE